MLAKHRQPGPLLRLALLCLLLGSQSLAAAHQLSHDFDVRSDGDGVQCPVCTLGGALDGALHSQAPCFTPEFAATYQPEPVIPSTARPTAPPSQPRAPPVTA
jgi:hypothetical protein